MKGKLSSVLFFLLLWGLSVPSFAQGLGSIVGTVTDPSGALLPGAKITVTETGTGLTRTAVTDSQGYYVIPSLNPAQYLVSAEASGFRTSKETVTLLANQNLTVNSRLQIGSPTETVEVTGAQLQVDTTTPTLKQVLEGQRVLDLPLEGRNAAQLTLLVPGTIKDENNGGADQGGQKTFPGAVTYSINGSRQNQTSYQLDGGNFVDEYSNVNQPFPFPDALQEFSVQTSNYGAEYGQNAGGVVNVVTKSGTDKFHGDAFEFVRNALFNARNWGSNFNAYDHGRDQLKRNQFGGTIGGPIIHDKTFFFVGYQGTQIRNLGDPKTKSVFTAAQRASATDPAIVSLLKLVPTGDPGAFDSAGQPEVTYAQPDSENYNEILGRIDHSITKNDLLTFRYDYNRYHKNPVFDPANILDYTDGTNAIINQNYLLHESHVFSTHLLNDFRFSYARETSDRGPAANVPDVSDFGVNIFQPTLGKGIQSVSVSGLSGFSFGDNLRAIFKRNNFTWSDDVSWIVGRHTFKFGGIFENSRVDITNPGFFGYGTFSFSSISNFLKGTMNNFQQGAGEFKNIRNNFPGLYLQDDFHANRKLTLTAGLRWEPFRAWDEVKHRTEVFNIADAIPGGAHSQVYTNAPPGLFFVGDPGVPERGVQSNMINFAPRLGFAYDVFGDSKTALRGGFGMFYDTRMTGLANNRVVDLTPFSPQVGPLTPPPGPFSDPYCQKTAGCTPINNPFPITLPVPSSFIFPLPLQIIGFDNRSKLKTPLIDEWNLGLQHEFPAGFLAQVAYVGSHGSHIKESVQLNPAFPTAIAPAACNGGKANGKNTFCDATRRLNLPFEAINPKNVVYNNVWQGWNDINSSYNSFQASLEKRAKAITLIGSYTWSKSIDDLPVGANVSEIGADTGGVSPLPWDDPNRHLFDRGPSEFDRTHRIVASYVLQLPQLSGWNTGLREVLGGWMLSGSTQFQTGRPLTVTSGRSSGTDSSGVGNGTDRATFIGGDPYGGNTCGSSPHCVTWLNSAVFQQPAPGTFGNAAKGALRGPNYWTWDMGLLKNFQVAERLNLQFRAEYFNVFNRVNLNDPSASTGIAAFNSSSFGQITGAGDPRIGQLAAKIIF